MRAARRLVIALAMGLGAAAWAVPAGACEPSTVPWASIPPSGATLPANAAVVLVGNANLDYVELRVDGVPVPFEAVPRLSGHESPYGWWTDVAVRPVDPPPLGATLEVEACDVWGCGYAPVFTFEVTAPDVDAPAAPTAAWFDLHDLPSGCPDSSCPPGEPDLAYWITVEGSAPDAGSPVVTLVRGMTVEAQSVQWIFGHADPQTGRLWHLTSDNWWDGSRPLELSMCFEVRTFDLAGNEAAWGFETCAPCHVVRTDEPDACWTEEEPAWTDADLFDGGECSGVTIPPLPMDDPDTGTTSGSSGATSSSGTGVSSTSDDTGGTGTSTGTGEPGGTTSSTDATSGAGVGSGSSTAATDSSATEGSTGTGDDGGDDDGTGDDGTGAPDTDGAGQSGGAVTATRGCACGSAPAGSSAPALVPMLLALTRRRRRRADDGGKGR